MPPGNAATNVSSKSSLSVIIPCYNELKNLQARVLDEVQEYMVQQPYIWEVIVANDESTDGSRDFVEEFVDKHQYWTLIDIPHGGKPAAVWGWDCPAHCLAGAIHRAARLVRQAE